MLRRVVTVFALALVILMIGYVVGQSFSAMGGAGRVLEVGTLDARGEDRTQFIAQYVHFATAEGVECIAIYSGLANLAPEGGVRAWHTPAGLSCDWP
jgi:hypothetical protein